MAATPGIQSQSSAACRRGRIIHGRERHREALAIHPEVKWLQDVMARSCSPPSTWRCFIDIGLAILCNTLQCSEIDASKAIDMVRYK